MKSPLWERYKRNKQHFCPFTQLLAIIFEDSMKASDLVYIDWNLFSIIKKPELKPHVVLDFFLTTNSDKITLVYSDAHLGDLSKMPNELKDERNAKLIYLSKKTKDLCIVKYFGRDSVDIEYRDALEFYETNVSDNSEELLIQFQNFVKQFNENYGATIINDIYNCV